MFVLFPQMSDNNKNIAVKNGKIEIYNGSCPNESDQILSETVRKLSLKLSTQLRIYKTVTKRWQEVFELLKVSFQVHRTYNQ